MKPSSKQAKFIVAFLFLAVSAVALLIGQTEPRFTTETFSVFELFWNSPDAGTLNVDAANKHHARIEWAQQSGLTQIATSTVWVFPPFADAPQVPLSKSALLSDVPHVRISCIPPLASTEYNRLVGIRNSMWKTLAREFPEIELWIVGYEPNFLFYDCEGRELEFQTLMAFFADTLEGANAAIKSQNPGATVVAHFLGRSASPIFFHGQLVQPREIVEGVLLEIAWRKDVQSKYFDQWAYELDPELILDRYPEPSVPLYLGSASLTSGWNTKYMEEFTTNSTHLVDDYADWALARSTDPITVTTVSNGLAHVTISGASRTAGGAVTEQNGPDVVPDQEFETQYPERNKWTAVSDFYGVTDPYDPGTHAAVFIRVLDRTWPDGINQTRFGGFVYGGLVTEGQGYYSCNNSPCGSIQFTGDDVTANPPQSAGKQYLFPFSLPTNELPWDNPSELYRVQIHERQVFNVFGQYELGWIAEVWKFSSPSAPLNQSYQMWEWTLTNSMGMAIPSLTSSKLYFALGPGTNYGGIDVERTGTAWWGY